jgi:S-adenosylmethionine hydrolase
MSSVITLTTDFGTGDAYAASVKGAIVSVNAGANIIDISHKIEPQNIRQAAFLLYTAHLNFPPKTIHLVVVDPGVGGIRRGIALKTPHDFFVAPDNGVLSYIIEEYCPELIKSGSVLDNSTSAYPLCSQLEAVALTRQEYWRHPVSPVFHGRDVFAPVAAHLSLGVPVEYLGEKIDRIYALPLPRPSANADGSITGCIVHIDTFGNLMTNIKIQHTAIDSSIITIQNSSIQGIHRCYDEMEGLGAIIGSSGYLELSVKGGNAQKQLTAAIGDSVQVKITLANG